MPPSLRLELLRDAPDWVVVAKPAGLATIPGRAEPPGETVLEVLAAQLGLPATGTADPRVRVVHRLDKDTSGVMLFAKTSTAQRRFSHQFQNNTVEKEYLALVAGAPTDDAGEVDAPLDRHPSDPTRMTVVRHGGRPARTLWRVERRFRGLTLIRAFPKTGKTHQIRVHLKHAGMPLAIDPLYNRPRPGERTGVYLSAFKRGYQPKRGAGGIGQEIPLIDRLTLHAEVLSFEAPDGERVRIECPVPKDLRATLNQLGKYAAR